MPNQNTQTLRDRMLAVMADVNSQVAEREELVEAIAIALLTRKNLFILDRDFKDKNTGERATDWIDVVAWRSTGEFVSRYFSKGRMAVVEGRLQIREWTDKEGNKRYTAEVVADSVYFGDSKPKDGQGQSSNGKAAGNPHKEDDFELPVGYGSGGGSDFAEFPDDDGDLPF